MGQIKSSTFQVYYEDTDIGGVVYHANYLKFFERGRTDYLSEFGIDLITLFRQGVQFAVIDVKIRYIKPASLNDRIVVNTELTKVGGAKLEFAQRIVNQKAGDQDLCRAEIVVGCLDKGFKPIRIPKGILKELV